MPKYAILSDIHANVAAFEKVLEKCSDSGVDKFISLGDVVGYNAEPARCVAMLRELKPVARVKGNHDDYAVRGDLELSGFNTNAKIAIKWTHDQLSADDLAYLDEPGYDCSLMECDSSIVHATLDSPESWGYVFDSHHAAASFSYQKSQICFCGHSHVPVAFDRIPFASAGRRMIERLVGWDINEANPEADDDFNIADELTVTLEKGHKYLFNIGSIGQPRNSDPRASFAILNTDARTVTRYRIPYDIARTQQKVYDAGLPERLAVRLQLGR